MTYVCRSTDDERSEIRNNTESWSFPPRHKAMTNTTQVSNSLSFSLKSFLTKNKAFLHFSITCVNCLQWLFWGQILFLSVIPSSSVTVQLLFYYLFFSCAKQKHILLILRFSKSAHNRKLVLVGLLEGKKNAKELLTSFWRNSGTLCSIQFIEICKDLFMYSSFKDQWQRFIQGWHSPWFFSFSAFLF